MGGGGGKSQGQTGANVIPFAKMFEGETRPLRQQLFGNITEALRTGGSNANVPIIQSAVSGARGAMSDALRGTTEGFARSGLSGTPFAARTLAGSRMQGTEQISQIPTQIVQALMGMAQQGVGLTGGILGPLASGGFSSSKQGHGGILN